MALEYIADGTLWLGEPINEVRHPRTIERLWTETELAEVGLRVRASPPPPPPSLSQMRSSMVSSAWGRAMSETDAAIVVVTTSMGDLPFGCDAGTQDNLQKVLLGILTGMTPNPRPWTPKGALQPVMLTHDDLKAVAGAVGARYDAIVQAYLVHKAAILVAGIETLQAYNLNSGWPG